MGILEHLNLIAPGVGLLVVVAFFALARVMANSYIKVPPNRVAIFYGRWRQTVAGERVGFRVVTRGSKLKYPIVESVTYLDLNVFSIDLKVAGAPNKDGVLTNVKAVANVKILSDEASLMAACERFLGMDPSQIKDIAYKNLEGHLRAIIGKLTMEEIVSDRTRFNQEVLQEAATDLKKIGLGIDVLAIQEVDDEHGYITALGQRRTAEVKRDATIGTAEAERDATIRESTAKREAQQTASQNEALIAQSERDRDVQRAQFDAAVGRERATAGQAGPLADAQARENIIKAQAQLALAEADKREKELLATVVRPAEAERTAAIARAEGEREAAIKTAEAEQKKLALEGEGRAAAILAEGRARAEVIRLELEAQAQGILQKAEAYAKLQETGMTLQVLEQLRLIIPEALRELAPVMAEIAKPLGSVDRISLVDFGNGNGSGNSSIARFAQIVPSVLLQLFEGMRAAGLDPTNLANLLHVGEVNSQKPV